MTALTSHPARTGVGAIAVLFGLLTIASGGMALFGSAESRAAVGNAVPFVLWFNFLAGFAYVATGAGIVAGRPWSLKAAVAIAGATILVFALFGLHVLQGGAYEMRTVGAMALRSGFWLFVAAYLGRRVRAGAAL
ncbi:hypothetical protein [Prosthecomicrobium sp. N25]|uniref:hypothetical protein n=1 Tax=Prosthecomicrobium sp. N25 TaxID=3129254 RepID=UPI00307805EB